MVVPRSTQSFTVFGWIVCSWILISSFQYGYHISALNQIQTVVTCRTQVDSPEGHYRLPACIPMTDAEFSLVTSSFTVGGLVGSLLANILSEKYGRKGAIKANSFLIAAGTALMSASSSIPPFLFGRTLIGIGAGIGICTGPVYIGEIAPASVKGGVGVLTQLSVVFGILVTQSLGMSWATPHQWRLVMVFSSLVSVVQLVASVIITESPAWLNGNGRTPESHTVSVRLWGAAGGVSANANEEQSNEDLEDPLLTELDERSTFITPTKSISTLQLLRTPEMRRPLLIMAFAMSAQQFSGINAVLYYSNDILSNTLPFFAAYVSLGITVVNVLMTFPPIFLIERLGRKKLIYASIAGALLSLVLVGYGLNSGMKVLSSIAIIAFVASFACGLGPVPFVIISDIAPYHAVSALSSFALSLNWIANFIVGVIFLPFRNLLAWGDPAREGRVFYVFAISLALFSYMLSREYKRF